MGNAVDPQIAGIRDNVGHGEVQARIASGDLVLVPFVDGAYSTSLAGTAAASFNGGTITGNPDGSGTGFFVVVPQGSSSSQQGVAISFIAYGTVFGLSYALSSANPDFGVLIDRVAYEVPSTRVLSDTQAVMSAGQDPAHLLIIADDLPDLPRGHEITIVFPYDSSAQRTWTIYGYIAERRRGYPVKPRSLGLYEVGLVSNVAARIIPSSNGWRGLRKVLYHNTSGSAVDVTITLSGNTIKVISVPANGSAEWDLGDVTAVQRSSSAGTGSLFHVAGTDAVVRATALVGL